MFNIFNNNEQVDPLEEKHKVLIQRAGSLGKSLAQRGVPKVTGDTIASHISPIRGGYKNLLTTFAKPATGNEPAILELEKRAQADKQVRLESKLKDTNEKHQKLLLEKEQLPDVSADTKGRWWIHLLIILVALFESLLTRKALAIIDSNNNVYQIIMLIVLTAVFVALPFSLVRIYHGTKESRYRIIIWAAVAILITAGFSVFGVMRSLYLEHIGATSVEHISANSTVTIRPIFWTILQCLLLFISSMCASFLPSPVETNDAARMKKIDEKIASVENEIQRIENDLGNLPDRALRSEMSRSDNSGRAANMQTRIEAMYHEAVGVFIETNTRWRSERPDCFDTAIPEL